MSSKETLKIWNWTMEGVWLGNFLRMLQEMHPTKGGMASNSPTSFYQFLLYLILVIHLECSLSLVFSSPRLLCDLSPGISPERSWDFFLLLKYLYSPMFLFPQQICLKRSNEKCSIFCVGEWGTRWAPLLISGWNNPTKKTLLFSGDLWGPISPHL